MSDTLPGSPAPRESGPAPDQEAILRQIDAFLRTAAVPSNAVPQKLARFITAEKAPSGACPQDSAAHHPDAREVLRRARERQPTVERFATATIRAALRGVLYDRWTMAAARRTAEQPPDVADRVLKRLTRFAPGRCAEDVGWVWCRLVKKFPENEQFDYSERQIRGAWREVASDRRRWDKAGGGPQPSPARQACKAALRRAAGECGRTRREIAGLEIVDYEPLSGTLRLSAVACDSIVLSCRGRKAMATWLALRGAAAGKLFELPAAPIFSAAHDRPGALELDERRDGNAVDGAQRLEEADLVEQVCKVDDALLLIYIRDNLATGGDWPERLLEWLDARCRALAASIEGDGVPTKTRRQQARARCIRRWQRLAQSWQ